MLQNTVCMLSSEAVAFLKMQFQRRCSERDGLLPLDLLIEDTGPQSLFHHAPPVSNHAEHPLGKQNIRALLVMGADRRRLPLESFLCIWAYCALVDARKAVIAMLYLGYPDAYRRYLSRVRFVALFSCPLSRSAQQVWPPHGSLPRGYLCTRT